MSRQRWIKAFNRGGGDGKRMKVCLVTGATGFIGQHMLAELAAAGRKMLALGKPEEVFCTAVCGMPGFVLRQRSRFRQRRLPKAMYSFALATWRTENLSNPFLLPRKKAGWILSLSFILLPAPRFRKRRKTEGKPGGRIMTGQGMSLQRRCGAGSGTTVRSGDFLRFYGQGLRRRQPQFVP